MIDKKIKVPLFEMLLTLSNVVDFMSHNMHKHQIRVAYIAFRIGEEMGLNRDQLTDVVMASLVHDIGALSLQDRMDTLHFEVQNPNKHAELGYRLLKKFPPFENISRIIRYHHGVWKDQAEKFIPIESFIIHLADRVEIQIQKDEDILFQKDKILTKILTYDDNYFMPKAVEALKALGKREFFWLETVSDFISSILSKNVVFPIIELDLDDFIKMARVFAHLIDFRSRFTATHSGGVAATSQILGRLTGLKEETCKFLNIAGYLHDLGKLAIPIEILEKPSQLTKEEFDIIKSHSFYTYYILESFQSLDVIRQWAAFHHERLNGEGYPFHINEEHITFEARIVAVADIFTALTEERPYRKGMKKDKVIEILNQMVEQNILDQKVVLCLIQNYDEINSNRILIQKKALKEYEEFLYDTEFNEGINMNTHSSCI